MSDNCDDGERNGRPDSLCRLNCITGRVDLWLVGEAVSPHPVQGIDLLQGGAAGGLGVVVTAFDDSGLHVLADLSTAPQWFDLRVGGRPTSFRVLNDETGGDPDFVYWIEAGGTLPAPTLFRAQFYFHLPELPIEDLGPTPFPGGQGGHILTTRARGEGVDRLLVADRGSVPPFDMYLGQIAFPSREWQTLDLGPSPGAVEVAVTDVAPWNLQDKPAPITRYMLDPPSVAIHGVSWDGSSLSAVTQFSWEYEPVNAVGGGVDETQAGGINAFITSDGTVYVWGPGPLPKTVGPYATVAPGTTQIVALSRGDAQLRDDHAVLEPSGEIVFLSNNGADRSLMPQRFKIGPPCERCVLAAWRETTYLMAALDDNIYLLHVVEVPGI